MRRLLSAFLVLLSATDAAAQEQARYPLIWRSEAAVVHGGELRRIDETFHILSPSIGISNLATTARAPLPNLPHMIFADERRFVGLVQTESHYFSDGIHGRLV
ncbi:MAG TPA: hypothetical protein VEF55_03270, partial [Candidatus Binatia bacterium]|nr:hypothetical protein [Candidatus Binatia bacterium]